MGAPPRSANAQERILGHDDLILKTSFMCFSIFHFNKIVYPSSAMIGNAQT